MQTGNDDGTNTAIPLIPFEDIAEARLGAAAQGIDQQSIAPDLRKDVKRSPRRRTTARG